MSTSFKHYAFISYSRKDSRAAAWLQRRLEWFRFPVKLVPEDRRPSHPRYVRPIYRDKTNLEVTDEPYWTNLRRALEQSRYLIVLCSEHSAVSEPVNMEVAHFLDTHGSDVSLLAPVIVSGSITSTGADAAFCPALRALGDTLITRNLPTMVSDATTAEPDAWEQGFVSLVSFLLQVERRTLGDHTQRETKRQARVLQRWLVAVGMLTVIAGVLAWMAFTAKRDVEKANVVIVEKNEKITSQSERNLKNLHEASMADYAVAVQRIEKDGKWHEGLAHLGRALKWEPGNALVAARLYSALAFYAPETWPRETFRTEAMVRSAHFSPDGQRVVTASDDWTFRLWEAATGNPVGEPMRHKSEGSMSLAMSVQFSADSTRIITATAGEFGNGEARVWDATTGKPLTSPLRHESVERRAGVPMSAQFSPDGKRIVTAIRDNSARLWDAVTGQPVGEPLRHESRVTSAQFSPDSTRIVTASGKTAQLWDAVTGRPLGQPLRHESDVDSAQFSPDGTRIATEGYTTACVWDLATGQQMGEPIRHEGGIWSVQFSPDGQRLVSASLDKTARVWEAATGKPVSESMRHEAMVRSAHFSPDGTRIVTASDDSTARLWEAATGKPVGEPMRHESGVVSAEFSGDGRSIITASLGTARVWEAPMGQPAGEPLRPESTVTSAQFSPDGTRFVTSGKTARVWDVIANKPVGKPMRHEGFFGRVKSAQFSPDGHRIVTASGDMTAQIWEAATGKPMGEPLRHESYGSLAHLVSAQFSPDGQRIVTATEDNTVRIWDATTGKRLGDLLRHDGVKSAQFSPDGRRIITAGFDYTARLWDAVTGQPASKPLRHKSGVESAQFSRDGRFIVTASFCMAQIWEAATGKLVGEPMRHEGYMWSAQFSPDGQFIVTASDRGHAQVWIASTGQPIGEPLRHKAWNVFSAQFSPDGQRILTASDNDAVRIWDISKLLCPPVPVPEWMLHRISAVAGLEFDAGGNLREIPAEQRRAVLLEAPPGNDEWTKLARWLAQPANKRTLTPDSRFTCRQIAERERDSGYKEGIASALRYDPTVPLAHILWAKFEDNPQRADFFRGYGLKLLPNDATLCARAAASLVEQKDFTRALKIAEKALALDSTNAEAQKSLTAAVEAMKGK